MAFLMPVNASIQDLVLQFPRADVTLLARQGQEESRIGQCSIEGQGQEILVCGKNKFVTSTDPSFFEPKPGLFDKHRQITHEVEMHIPLSLLKTISVKSTATDVPAWTSNGLVEGSDIPFVRGIHLCEYLPGDCSCSTVTRLDSSPAQVLRAYLPRR